MQGDGNGVAAGVVRRPGCGNADGIASFCTASLHGTPPRVARVSTQRVRG